MQNTSNRTKASHPSQTQKTSIFVLCLVACSIVGAVLHFRDQISLGFIKNSNTSQEAHLNETSPTDGLLATGHSYGESFDLTSSGDEEFENFTKGDASGIFMVNWTHTLRFTFDQIKFYNSFDEIKLPNLSVYIDPETAGGDIFAVQLITIENVDAVPTRRDTALNIVYALNNRSDDPGSGSVNLPIALSNTGINGLEHVNDSGSYIWPKQGSSQTIGLIYKVPKEHKDAKLAIDMGTDPTNSAEMVAVN